MFNLNDKVRPHPQVVDTPLDDQETVLLHLETKTYFTLNSTGALIWRGVKVGKDLGEIAGELEHGFDVTRAHAEESVLTLIEDLNRHGLLFWEERPEDHGGA